MIEHKYFNLLGEFRDVAELAGSLKATLSRYGDAERPHEIGLWTIAVAGYVHVMMCLALHLAYHADWAAELDILMEPLGCPAQKVPVVLEFLRKKGVEPNEGMALDIP